MLGDQLAIASVVRSQASFDAKTFSSHEPFLEDIGGTSVLFLPCEVYNWTPPEGAGQFHGMLLDVKNDVVCYEKANIMAQKLDALVKSILGGSFQGIKETTYARVLELLELFIFARSIRYVVPCIK
ncbi:hypothetical protein Tco_1497045 [Tanacetum coccineum]